MEAWPAVLKLDAGRFGNTGNLGTQQTEPWRVGRALGFEGSPAGDGGAAVAALRLVQAEIVLSSRIVGQLLQRLGEGLHRGLGDGALGFEGKSLAQRSQRLGIVGILRELCPRVCQQA